MSDLAVHGGKPVRERMLPYGRQSLSDDDIRAVVEVLRSDWWTTGPMVDEFEREFARYVGAQHAVAFSSGTAALHGAMFAAHIGPGDEVITTPITFCATSNSVLYQGATPVFADVSPDTLNLDPDEIVRRITKTTRAVAPVDYAGHPADLGAILAIASQHGLIVIEDASHALGAEYRGRRIGGFGHMTTFSFHPVKHVATGEGGMVTTNDAALDERLRLFRNHGIAGSARARALTAQWYYEMVDLGYNYRLTDIASALGLSQLRTLDENVARRRQIARRYSEALKGCAYLSCPVEREDARSAWHLYPIRLKLSSLEVGRAEIFAALRAENIGVNVHYIPVHYHPFYQRRFPDGLGRHPRAETAYEELLSLPMFHAMLDSDIDDVIAAVRKVTQYYGR